MLLHCGFFRFLVVIQKKVTDHQKKKRLTLRKRLTLSLTLLPARDITKIISDTLLSFPPEKRKKIIISLLPIVFPDVKLLRIKKSMEKLFMKNPDLKPIIAARMIRHYMKMDSKMLPFLLRLARNAKRRVKRKMTPSGESVQNPCSSTN